MSTREQLSKRWREASLAYVAAVNAYVDRGMNSGWKNAGEKPVDTRHDVADEVMRAVREANCGGDINQLREQFPPAYEPFATLLGEFGQPLSMVLLLDDGRVLVRVGAPHEEGRVLLLSDLSIEPLDSGILTVGRSADRRFFAVARVDGVELREGWEGAVRHHLPWPTDWATTLPRRITALIPFPDGERVLLVGSEGIGVLTPDGPHRLDIPMEDGGDWELSMEHGAVSPDGELIAIGHQDSRHLILDGRSYKHVAEIGPHCEYPHYAFFSADGSMLAFNACHIYHGTTIGVRTSEVHGMKTEFYEKDRRIVALDTSARVYAAVAANDELIFGDANGYVVAVDVTGAQRWRHFVGSTVQSIDLSSDAKRLVVGTYYGVLSRIDLNTGQHDPFTIGTATHREKRRWLFLSNEQRPLVW